MLYLRYRGEKPHPPQKKMTAIDWKNLPWTNELGKATHIIERTGVKVMIYERHEDGLIHALCGNEASVWVNENELVKIWQGGIVEVK